MCIKKGQSYQWPVFDTNVLIFENVTNGDPPIDQRERIPFAW